MNKKKWLSALLIIGVLAIAYFWGGNYAKSPETAIATTPITKVEPILSPSPGSDTMPALSGQQSVTTEKNEPATPDQSQPASEEKPSTSETDIGNDDQTTKPSEESKSSTTPLATVKSSAGETGAGNGSGTPPSTKPPAALPEETKDKYQTDPVPSGKPKPVEWQDVEIDKNKSLTVTLSVSAATILNNLDSFNEDKLEVLPKDGIIYKTQKVAFYEGESVFDVLLREMKKNKIHMEFEMTPIYNSNYIEGIHNIYEFDCGELSGWMYKVNGWFPSYGASRYALQDGDVVEWVYTCDLGRDVGGYNEDAGDKS